MALFYRANVISSPLLNGSHCTFVKNVTRLKSERRQQLQVIDRCLTNLRKNSQGNNISHASNGFVPFEIMIDSRKKQANKSILVQVQSNKSSDDLFTYCSQFGNISNMHHYRLLNNKHFILIEFENLTSVKEVMSSAGFVEDNVIAAVKTQTLWFHNVRLRQKLIFKSSPLPLTVSDGIHLPDTADITKVLHDAKDVSQQMKNLYELLKLNDLETRLRFYTVSQLEYCFSKLFPDVVVTPFGSTVNGFGKQGCDLDLIFSILKCDKKSPSRLIFHSKPVRVNQRQEQKEFLITMASIMQNLIPGIGMVRKILEARVPIIKFNHSYTNIECDLTIYNLSGIYMSELLYIYGKIDARVQPLIFTIRSWAREHKLTQTTPGRWLTNFSISLLVIFFLQQRNVLPTLNKLKQLATHADIRYTNDAIDCTFVRDISNLLPTLRGSGEDETLEQLLRGFFEYYAIFDFDMKAISIREGKPIRKIDSSPIYICNPLETTLNVSKNVSLVELERFVMHSRDATFILETVHNPDTWGLMSLFGLKVSASISSMMNTYPAQTASIDSIILEANEKADEHSADTLNGTIGQKKIKQS